MKCGEPFLADLPFVRPHEVVAARIDRATGELATSECPVEQIVEEVFVRGSEPSRACSTHLGDLPHDAPSSADEQPETSRERSFWESLFD
jgi:membrane carboxypeptidase/penicillin-binding protein